jgi:hypothetical protein
MGYTKSRRIIGLSHNTPELVLEIRNTPSKNATRTRRAMTTIDPPMIRARLMMTLLIGLVPDCRSSGQQPQRQAVEGIESLFTRDKNTCRCTKECTE